MQHSTHRHICLYCGDSFALHNFVGSFAELKIGILDLHTHCGIHIRCVERNVETFADSSVIRLKTQCTRWISILQRTAYNMDSCMPIIKSHEYGMRRQQAQWGMRIHTNAHSA